jgi:hypothetical protein
MDARALFLQTVKCGKRTVYVSASSGNDANDGSQAHPYQSINWAAHQALPGDMILVATGVYAYTEVRGFQGDNAGGWLGILPIDENAVVQLNVASPTDNFFNIIGSSFVGVYGIEVFGDQNDSNTNASGISIYGDSHHVLVWGCSVHDFPGGGINCFDFEGSQDMLDIRFNTIHGTSKFSPENTSGISIYASRDLTGTTWDGTYAHKIIGNYIYDVICTVPFTPGGFAFVTDGNGISIDSIQTTYGYTKPILIEGNVIVGCGGRAVHVFNSVNTDLFANTGIGNLRTSSPAITDGVEFDGTTDTTVRIIGNIVCPLNTPNTQDTVSTFTNNVIAGGTQAVSGGNIDRRSSGIGYFTGPLDQPGLLNAQPISVFVPSAPDFVPKQAKTTGYQCLLNGPRPTSNWAAGALEAPLPPRIVLAH